MIQLASKTVCSGCGACAAVCPKQCVKMQIDSFGAKYPNIDDSCCVECRRCQSVCPVLNPISGEKPLKVFAARSNDSNVAVNSASGGIAVEIYKYGISVGACIVGAKQNEDFSVSLELSKDDAIINRFQNSKYVFSEAYKVYGKIEDCLKKGEKVLIIALPCQIAAVKNLFLNKYDNLFFVDIVCHGTTPVSYLQHHIRKIESRLDQKAVKMSFRDPEFKTSTFTFTLYNSANQCFYANRTKGGDTYQYGYHRHLSYRENCYHCLYACPERQGDITLADFPGLGKFSPFPYEKENISSVLINTNRGLQLIEKLIRKNKIFVVERTFEEVIASNGQLRRPTPKPYLRSFFLKRMISKQYDFEKAIYPLMFLGLLSEKMNRVLKFPLRIVNKIKKTVKNML